MMENWNCKKTYEPSTLLHNWYEDRLKYKQHELQPGSRLCYDFSRKDLDVPDIVKHQTYWGDRRKHYLQQNPVKITKQCIANPELFGPDYNWGLVYNKRLFWDNEKLLQTPTTYVDSYCTPQNLS